MGFSKKGISAVIASVLLILLVIAMALIISLWSRGFFGEQIEKFDRPIDTYCEDVSFDAQRIHGEGGFDSLEVINRGNVNIYGFEVKLTYKGNSEVSNFFLVVASGKAASGVFYFRMSEGGQAPDKVEIFPLLSGTVRGESGRKTFTCRDTGKVLN
jgi:hypothetical protein